VYSYSVLISDSLLTTTKFWLRNVSFLVFVTVAFQKMFVCLNSCLWNQVQSNVYRKKSTEFQITCHKPKTRNNKMYITMTKKGSLNNNNLTGGRGGGGLRNLVYIYVRQQ
jgi:hypothetical protein